MFNKEIINLASTSLNFPFYEISSNSSPPDIYSITTNISVVVSNTSYNLIILGWLKYLNNLISLLIYNYIYGIKYTLALILECLIFFLLIILIATFVLVTSC